MSNRNLFVKSCVHVGVGGWLVRSGLGGWLMTWRLSHEEDDEDIQENW